MWPACSKNWAGSNMPDLTSCIWFSSVFPKKAWIILCKTDLDPIWMAWSGFGQTHLVWKQASVHWPTTSFSFLDLIAFFHRRPGSYCAKPAQIWFSSGWLSGLGQTDWSRSKLVLQEFFPMLPTWSRLDVDRIQHVYWGVSMSIQNSFLGVSFLKQASDNEGSTCISPVWKVECLNLSHICSTDMIYLESCSADAIWSQPCENFSRLFPDFPVQVPDHGHVRIFPGCSLTFQCRSLVSME